jgi:hypothetical protein
MSYEKEQSVAIQACLQAAKLCERVRSTIPDAIEKLDRSPVTVRHRKMIFVFFSDYLRIVSRFWFTSINMSSTS